MIGKKELNKILGKARMDANVYYLIEWKPHLNKSISWQPSRNLSGAVGLRQFNTIAKSHPLPYVVPQYEYLNSQILQSLQEIHKQNLEAPQNKYKLEQIVGKAKFGNSMYYLMKWQDQDAQFANWLPAFKTWKNFPAQIKKFSDQTQNIATPFVFEGYQSHYVYQLGQQDQLELDKIDMVSTKKPEYSNNKKELLKAKKIKKLTEKQALNGKTVVGQAEQVNSQSQEQQQNHQVRINLQTSNQSDKVDSLGEQIITDVSERFKDKNKVPLQIIGGQKNSPMYLSKPSGIEDQVQPIIIEDDKSFETNSVQKLVEVQQNKDTPMKQTSISQHNPILQNNSLKTLVQTVSKPDKSNIFTKIKQLKQQTKNQEASLEGQIIPKIVKINTIQKNEDKKTINNSSESSINPNILVKTFEKKNHKSTSKNANKNAQSKPSNKSQKINQLSQPIQQIPPQTKQQVSIVLQCQDVETIQSQSEKQNLYKVTINKKQTKFLLSSQVLESYPKEFINFFEKYIKQIRNASSKH